MKAYFEEVEVTFHILIQLAYFMHIWQILFHTIVLCLCVCVFGNWNAVIFACINRTNRPSYEWYVQMFMDIG